MITIHGMTQWTSLDPLPSLQRYKVVHVYGWLNHVDLQSDGEYSKWNGTKTNKIIVYASNLQSCCNNIVTQKYIILPYLRIYTAVLGHEWLADR